MELTVWAREREGKKRVVVFFFQPKVGLIDVLSDLM